MNIEPVHSAQATATYALTIDNHAPSKYVQRDRNSAGLGPVEAESSVVLVLVN